MESIENKTEEIHSGKMSKEDFTKLVTQAKELDIYRPTWCPDFHFDLYKICYLMVKEDKALENASATLRKRVIMKLMNTHISHARQIIYDQAKAKHEEQKANTPVLGVSDEKPNA